MNLYASTLWYGTAAGLYAMPLKSDGGTASITFGSGGSQLIPRAMTVAPDGTLYNLDEVGSGTASASWQLRIFAPGANGAAQPEQVISGKGHPQEVVLVDDGIDVLSSAATATAGLYGAATLATFAYAAGDNPKPIRTLHLGYDVSDVAVDGNGRLYVAHTDPSGVHVYPAGASCNCSVIREIKTPQTQQVGVAVGPEGTVYVLTSGSGTGATESIVAYANGSNGPAPSRTIASGLHGAQITVDSSAQLYAAVFTTSQAGNGYSVSVWSSYAAGSGHVGTLGLGTGAPEQIGGLTSLAIGPAVATSTPPPAWTIYVGYPARVDAYSLASNGKAAPSRSDNSANPAQAIAADNAGALYVVSAAASAANRQAGWNVYAYARGSNGSSGTQIGIGEPGVVSAAAIDLSYHSVDVENTGYFGEWELDGVNYDGTGSAPPRVTGGGTGGLAEDAVGTRYVAAGLTSNLVAVYDRGAADSGAQNSGLFVPAPVSRWIGAVPADGSFAEGVAVAPDGTVYVGVGKPNGNAVPTGAPMSIDAFAPGAGATSAPSRVITGTFSYPISLAMGSAGQLVVLHDSRVDTFAATANGAAVPIRTLTVPAGTIAGPSALAVGP